MAVNTSCVLSTTVNLSHHEYPGEASEYKTLYALDYAKLVFIGFIMAGTVVGNFSVIIVIGLNKKIQTVIDIYIANLASADLLVCSICMTSFLWKNMLNNHIFVLGPEMCKLIHFCQMTTLICSVMTLSAIACDRANAVLFPLHHLANKPRTKLVILSIWLVSISASVPLILVRTLYTLHFKDFVQKSCGDNWPLAFDEESGSCQVLRWVPQLYYTFMSVTLFFLPISIMAITYSLILWRLAKSPPGETNEANLSTQNRNRKKIIKMVFTVLIVFIICWLPLQIILLYDKYRSDAYGGVLPFWYEEATRVAQFLAFSNSFLNPIIYGGFNKDFRDNICRYLRCCNKRRRRFGSSGFLHRFRTTLTTALTSSLRTTDHSDPRRDSKKGKAKLVPTVANGKDPSDDAERNDVHKTNEAVNDTIL